MPRYAKWTSSVFDGNPGSEIRAIQQTMAHVGTEMSLHVLAQNLKRVMKVMGIAKTMKAMQLAGA